MLACVVFHNLHVLMARITITPILYTQLLPFPPYIIFRTHHSRTVFRWCTHSAVNSHTYCTHTNIVSYFNSSLENTCPPSITRRFKATYTDDTQQVRVLSMRSRVDRIYFQNKFSAEQNQLVGPKPFFSSKKETTRVGPARENTR